MNTRRAFSILLLILLAAGLFGCGAKGATPEPTLAPVLEPTNPPVRRTPPPTPTLAASPTPAGPTATPVDPAVKTVEDYFAALEAGKADEAAAFFSNFSLMVDEMTRGDAADAIKTQIDQGARWSGLEVVEVKPFDKRTTLVHVKYQLAGKDAKTGEATVTAEATATAEATTIAEATTTAVDEWWPVRQESGQWRYNRGNLIDFKTLEIPQKTTAGLTIKPLRLTRYSDHLRLTLLAQNQTNEAIVLGQPNEIMATFLFGDQQVQAAPTRLVFAALHSYPETAIDVPGLFEQYPDGIIIRQWKNVKVEPWFTFSFH